MKTFPIATLLLTAGLGAVDAALVYGDPHFKTWSGEKFDFHGACDLVLLHNPEFAEGRGLDVHIRTQTRTWWSFVETAVVRIGEDVLEVQGGSGGGEYWINGVAGKPLEDHEKFTLSGYEVEFLQKSEKQKRYRIDLGTKSGDAISLETLNDFVAVNAGVTMKDFGNAVGLMGSYPEGEMLARDGVTQMEDADAFGMEWQVRMDEAQLFRNVGEIQPPMTCAMPDKTVQRSRRLGEAVMTEENAKRACENVAEDDREACVFDVLATNTKEIAAVYSEVVTGAF
jgi:hypothetical protein